MSGNLYLSRGQFNLETQWNIANDNCFTVFGAGAGITIIKAKATMGQAFVIQIATANDVTLKDFTVDGNRANRTIPDYPLPPQGANAENYNAIQVYNALRCNLHRVNILNSPEQGLNFKGTTTDSYAINCYAFNNMASAFSLYNVNGNGFLYCVADGNNISYGAGQLGAAGFTGNNMTNGTLVGCKAIRCYDGFTAGDTGGSGMIHIGCRASYCDRNGFAVNDGPVDSLWLGCISEYNTANGFSSGSNGNRNIFSSCKARYNTQWGFNIVHGVDLQLINCLGEYNSEDGVQFTGYNSNVNVLGGAFRYNTKYGVLGTDTSGSNVTLEHVNLKGNTIGPISYNSSLITKIKDCEGFIASGEHRTAGGSLTAGNANAIAFAWHNPHDQDILISKVMINITTGGGTVGSQLDVGIADDATGTNRGTEFFDNLLLNNTGTDDSEAWSGHVGQQTAPVSCQDSASATDGWIVGQILTQNAASLIGTYHIEYCGA